MSDAPPLLAILIAETAVGWPRGWRHPVEAAGALIGWAERGWNRGSEARRRGAGVALLLVLVALSVALGWTIERLAGRGWGLVLVVAIGTTGLAQRSLHDHVAAVLRPLARGDPPGAQEPDQVRAVVDPAPSVAPTTVTSAPVSSSPVVAAPATTSNPVVPAPESSAPATSVLETPAVPVGSLDEDGEAVQPKDKS